MSMNRNEKIAKLAQAITDYRGICLVTPEGEKVKWKRAPRPKEIERVKNWMIRLGMNVEESLAKMESFKNFDEFNAWLKGL